MLICAIMLPALIGIGLGLAPESAAMKTFSIVVALFLGALVAALSWFVAQILNADVVTSWLAVIVAFVAPVGSLWTARWITLSFQKSAKRRST